MPVMKLAWVNTGLGLYMNVVLYMSRNRIQEMLFAICEGEKFIFPISQWNHGDIYDSGSVYDWDSVG